MRTSGGGPSPRGGWVDAAMVASPGADVVEALAMEPSASPSSPSVPPMLPLLPSADAGRDGGCTDAPSSSSASTEGIVEREEPAVGAGVDAEPVLPPRRDGPTFASPPL